MTAKKIALFIDADNISAKFGKQIIENLEKHGEIFIRRVYGNWEKSSLRSWNDCILNLSLRAVQQPDYVAGKNATDMSLAIDAMDILYGGKAEIFALVSNDSDFTPLAIRLREGGMKIIGMGNANAANSFRLACDEFIDLDLPVEVEISAKRKKKVSPEKVSPVQLNLFFEEKIPSMPVVANPKVISISNSKIQSDRDKKIQQIHNILREVANMHDDANGFFLLNRVRMEIRDKNLGFSVKDLGYETLREFIAAFPKLYELNGSGAGTLVRCLTSAQKNSDAKNKSEQLPDLLRENNAELFKGQISNAEDKLRQLHNVLKEAAKTHGDASGFLLLNLAGVEIKNKNLGFGVKDLGYSTLKEFIEAFPKLYELQRTGTIASYRCRTNEPKNDKIQQIHKVLRETAKARSNEKGFVDLTCAGQNIREKKLTIKGSGHSTLSKFISAFPNLYELKKNTYRCKK